MKIVEWKLHEMLIYLYTFFMKMFFRAKNSRIDTDFSFLTSNFSINLKNIYLMSSFFHIRKKLSRFFLFS